MRQGWKAVLGAVVVATSIMGVGPRAGASGPAPSKARLVTLTVPAPHGEIASQWLSYPGPPRANVLLPAGYNRRKQYPLVVFLNGLDFNYASYAKYGLTKPLQRLGAIVVMPEGGDGWYADWWNDGQRGSPSWESYELDSVIPTILSRYPVLPQRRYHALIGISMGGLGATYLGGRLPGFFGSVATLSGFVDTQYMATGVQSAMASVSDASTNGDSDPDPIYGPPQGFYSAGHNPVALVKNLKDTRVFESTGTGVPSKATPHPTSFEIFEEKTVIYPMNVRYHKALVSAGIGVTYQVHPGVHGLADFRNELGAMLKWGLFKSVTTAPASWQNTTVATSGQLWDFNYAFANPPDRVVTFHQSGTKVSISKAGTAVTITASTGCAIHTATPAVVKLPSTKPISPRRPLTLGHRACH